MEKASDQRHEWVDGVVYASSRGTPSTVGARGASSRLLNPLLDAGREIFASDTAIFIETASHHTYARAGP